VDALRKKAETLQKIAYDSPNNNRVIGSEGHQATIDWIHDTIAQFPQYYSLELQPFNLTVGESANLTVNGKSYDVAAVGLAPSGHVSAPLVAVANLGCEEVSVM
jgi:hypothetical protein